MVCRGVFIFMAKQEISKAYDPKLHEDGTYAAWEASGFFNPDNLPGERKETFSIVLPPPNVTGTLHMGHAVMLAIEDIMVRFARMQGKKALWLPGTDHAAIATSTKVEGIIFKEEKKTRHDLGREEFLRRVEKFAQDSHDTIVGQCRKMGASLDWSREAYTLDAARNRAVNTAFKKMYDDGLIYRGHRVVNWDPIGQTTISDIEIVYKEVEATLYTFKYSKDFPIAVSSTRPETKVGDTAVAVHPSDERYAHLVGKTFENIPFAGSTITITIVADESVDPKFGTGALGVTPAHSLIDADIATRHKLAMRQVIGEDGRMTAEAGSLVVGMTVNEARAAVVAWLNEQGLIEGEEKTMQNLATAERSGGVIEPIPMLQWFIDVNKPFGRGTIKSLTQDAVRSGKINIIPERFAKSYFDWADNLRDWCISRQLWYGHRIPAWYRGEEVFVGTEAPTGEGWTQDPDTLDTWFSAGMWTFTTLGWPDETADLKTYHPTTILETGYDILTFWVVRMVMMTTYLMNEVPFKTVYLHGLVRDEKGRKMSKSLDNIINPLDMIEKYGADATRLSLVIGSTPGNDSKLSEEKIAGYRNFTNKLWNISRFVLSSVGTLDDRPGESVTLADRWILGRLSEVTAKVTGHLERHEISIAGETLRDFTWNDFADWYLEIAKMQKSENTDRILVHVLTNVLKLWHPFMPFVTEAIWKEMGKSEFLMISEWPISGAVSDENTAKSFVLMQEVIASIRNLRAEYQVEPAKMISVVLADAGMHAVLESQAEVIKHLARVDSLTIQSKAEAPEGSVSAVCGTTQIFVPLSGLVDPVKEKVRLTKELDEAKAYATSLEGKLGNQEFVGKAPAQVVDKMKQNLAEAVDRVKAIQTQLSALS